MADKLISRNDDLMTWCMKAIQWYQKTTEAESIIGVSRINAAINPDAPTVYVSKYQKHDW